MAAQSCLLGSLEQEGTTVVASVVLIRGSLARKMPGMLSSPYGGLWTSKGMSRLGVGCVGACEIHLTLDS